MADDFFSSAKRDPQELTNPPDDLDTFQQAIGRRFSAQDTSPFASRMSIHPPPPTPGAIPLRTPSLSLGPPTVALTNHSSTPGSAWPLNAHVMPPPLTSIDLKGPFLSSHASAPPNSLKSLPGVGRNGVVPKHHLAAHSVSSRYIPIQPQMLEAFLCLDTTSSFQRPLLSSQLSPDVIVIDIRSHHYFLHSRIQSAINLSVPTMLLKRSSSTLEKLADMIAPASCQPIFNAWRSARRIIAYDVDSTALTSGSNILSLLRKFENEGFTGSLCFLQGGFSGISRVHPSLIDSRPLTPPGKDEESSRGVLHSCELPMAAFQQSSTTSAGKRDLTDETGRLPHESGFTKRTVANPFYDNIRQYLELSQGITERIPLELPEWVLERRDELPFEWLREIVRKASARSPGGHTGGEALEDLAMQFYRVELGEQKRLHGVMDHHSRESATENRAAKFPMKPIGLALNKSFFPYSITAGIEKGAKNRYRNIWPFEHARVRLIEPVDDDKSDYINASYIQPRGTTFRYIATQGPLESTFADFWTLCWEQNVSIIVMVTRQKEGNTVKCGNYWGDRNFGPLSLKLLKEEGPVHIDPPGENGGFGGYNFGIYDEHGKDKEEEEDTIIRRTFELRNSSYPEAPARKVTQLQYIGWPDLNVPKSPKHLLELIKELNKLRVEAKQHSIRMTGQKDESRRLSLGPVLVHCSAGVGRTGSFVMVDAILDAIRRETRTKMEQEIFRIKGRQEFKSDEDPPVFPPSHHSPPPLHPDDSGAIHLRYDRKPLTSADKRSVKKRRSDLGVFPSNMQSLPEEGAGRPITSPPSSLRNSASPRKKHHPNNSMTDLTAEKADILMAPLSRALESLRDLRRSAEPREGMSFSNAMELDNSDQATGAPSLASRGDFTGSHTPSWQLVSASPQPMKQTPNNLARVGQAKPSRRSLDELGASMDWDIDSTSAVTTHSSLVDGNRTGSSLSVERQSTAALSPLKSSATASSVEDKLSNFPEGSRLPSRALMVNSSGTPFVQGSLPADSPMKSTSHPPAHPSFPHTLNVSSVRGDLVSSNPSSVDQGQPNLPVPSIDEHAHDSGKGGSGSSHTTQYGQRGPKHSRRHPESTPASASDYVPPRMIRLPRDVSRRLQATDDLGSGDSKAVARSSPHAIPIPIPKGPVKDSPEARAYRSGLDMTDDEEDADERLKKPRRDSSGDSSSASPPSPLSTIAEPIREVLEDMRQQRMSLCQSLRQYVFVHLAVVVGALEIVDEINAELVERGVHNLSRHQIYPTVRISSPRLSPPQIVFPSVEASGDDMFPGTYTISTANLAQFNAEGGLYRLGNRASIKRKQPSIGSLTDEGTTSRT